MFIHRQKSQWSHELSDLFRAREQIGKSLAVSVERHRWLTEQERTLNSEIDALSDASGVLTDRIVEVEQEMDLKRAEVEEIESTLVQLEQVGTGEVEFKTTYRSSVDQLREEVENSTTQFAAKSMQVEQLSDQPHY